MGYYAVLFFIASMFGVIIDVVNLVSTEWISIEVLQQQKGLWKICQKTEQHVDCRSIVQEKDETIAIVFLIFSATFKLVASALLLLKLAFSIVKKWKCMDLFLYTLFTIAGCCSLTAGLTYCSLNKPPMIGKLPANFDKAFYLTFVNSIWLLSIIGMIFEAKRHCKKRPKSLQEYIILNS